MLHFPGLSGLADLNLAIGPSLDGLISAGLLPVGAAALALCYVLSSFIAWFRLRHVPGPFFASFSHVWLIRNSLLGISSAQLLGLKRYGSVVRIAPNYVLTDDPAALRRISGVRSTYGRDGWWSGLKIDPSQDNMLTTRDMATHDKLKAQTANGYSGHDNVDIEGCVNTQLEKLKHLIRRQYISTSSETRKVDLVWLIRFFTLDVITALAYGEPFGYLEANQDLFGFNKQIADMHKPVNIIVDTPILRTLVNSPLALPMFPKVTDKQGMGKLIR
jgi:hypothetical protein